MKRINEVIATHQLFCNGMAEVKGGVFLDVLSDDTKKEIIVKVYKNGKTIPLCGYFHDNKCTAPLDHNEYGMCIYNTE